MTGPEEAIQFQSRQQHSVPNVSSYVALNNGMKANNQAMTILVLLASPNKAANTPQLAGLESPHDFTGWTSKFHHHHSKFIWALPKGLSVKTKKQLAAETLQQRHKRNLDGGCILSRQEETSDIVIFCALYSSVNMEMEVILWKEKGEKDKRMIENKRSLTGGHKYMAKKERSILWNDNVYVW